MKQGYETADCGIYEILKKNAQENRNHPTEAESILWNILKGKSLRYRFRQQHVIKDYIVDFVCLRCRLIVEIDGGYHFTAEQQLKDKDRTDELNRLGFEVLRFTNEEIICDTDAVLNKIRQSLDDQIKNGKSIIK